MNKNSTKRTLNLLSEINMTKNHSKPDTSWSTFDDINSPVYNDALSPLYYETYEDSTSPLYSNKGDKYVYQNGALYKNNNIIHTTANKGFHKEILDIDSKSVIYHNDKFYYTDFKNGVLSIKSDTTITSQPFGSVDIIAERLYFIGDDLRYFCLHNDGTHSIYYNNQWHIGLENKWYLKDTLVGNDVEISSPIINVASNFIFVTNKKGPRIDYATLYWFMLETTSTITQINSFGLYQTTEPVTKDENVNIVASITTEQNIQSLTCTKSGDKYYNEEGEEITFSDGYVPALVEGDTYRYSLYTTEWKYKVNGTPSTHISNIKIQFNLSDVNYPEDVIDKIFSRTLVDGETTLSFKSNFGYISGNSLLNREATIEWTTGGNAVVPNTYFDIATFILNRNSATSKVIVNTYTETGNVTNGQFAQSIMMDDGLFYSLGYKSNQTSNTSKLLNAKNRISGRPAENAILLQPISSYSDPITSTDGAYNYWRATTVQLGQDYFRSLMFFIKDPKTKTMWNHFGLVNDIFRYYPGHVEYKDLKYADSDLNNLPFSDNNRGDRVGRNHFKALYNNGYVSGISYTEDEDVQGTLLSPWLSVDTESYFQLTDTFALYKNTTLNKWVMISLVDNASDMKLIEDRYLVLNTTDYFNGWDIKLESLVHYASDWNNRMVLGGGSLVDAISNDVYTIASGENVIYQQSESGITSALWPAESLVGLGVGWETDTLYVNNIGKNIDIFGVKGTGVPKYISTYSGKRKLNNPLLDVGGSRVGFPTISSSYIRINPNLFTKFISTGNNQDYLVDDGWAYSLIYDNGVTPILQASTTSYIEDMEALFVIQSMPYGVMNNRLYSLNYLNGVYQGADAIMNIKGMQYVGSIPTKAYFYSPMNRCLYSFTGDANMSLIKEASAIGKIYGTWYNSATQTVYMATDNGLYMLSAENTYRQEFFAISNIYFNDDGSSYIINKENNDFITYHIALEHKDGYKTNKVRLDTGLLGSDGNENIVIDRWNISLWHEHSENGEIKVHSYTLTDKGTVEKEEIVKEIKANDWDKEWQNIQISWVPKYNRGIGVGCYIESDFAITSIVASVSKDINTMPSKVNI